MTPEGVSILAAPTQVVLAIQPLVDLTADGTQVWDSQMVSYFWTGGRVYRRV